MKNDLTFKAWFFFMIAFVIWFFGFLAGAFFTDQFIMPDCQEDEYLYPDDYEGVGDNRISDLHCIHIEEIVNG